MKGHSYHATFSDVYVALEYEISNMVFLAGLILVMQKMGAGMGGKMSPFAARVTCIVQEHKWQLEIRKFLSSPIVMTRLMDDAHAVQGRHIKGGGCQDDQAYHT